VSLRVKKNKDLGPQAARDSALRSLARREHSARELNSKLRARGYEADVVQDTVARLADRGLQSDERYAEQLVQHRVAQCHGRMRIEAELRAAGVPDAIARAALEAAGCDWSELCHRLQQRRFRAPPADREDWARQYRFLAARGFSHEDIRAALRLDPEDEAG
jgi:regulatory protein